MNTQNFLICSEPSPSATLDHLWTLHDPQSKGKKCPPPQMEHQTHLNVIPASMQFHQHHQHLTPCLHQSHSPPPLNPGHSRGLFLHEKQWIFYYSTILSVIDSFHLWQIIHRAAYIVTSYYPNS